MSAGDPTQQPAPPAPDPAAQPPPAAGPDMAALQAALGFDPTAPEAADIARWGRDIWNPDQRLNAVVDLAKEDPRVVQAIAERYGLVPGGLQPQPQGGQPAAPAPQGEEFDAIFSDPTSFDGYVDQRVAQQLTAEREAMNRQFAEQRVQDQLAAQVNALPDLSEQQRGEVFQRAWGATMQGRHTDQTFRSAASQALSEIQGMWAPAPVLPPQPPPDPNLTAAQQLANQQAGAPTHFTGGGQAPGGSPVPTNLQESGQSALAQIAAMKAQGLG